MNHTMVRTGHFNTNTPATIVNKHNLVYIPQRPAASDKRWRQVDLYPVPMFIARAPGWVSQRNMDLHKVSQ